jgi:hypothetical protein
MVAPVTTSEGGTTLKPKQTNPGSVVLAPESSRRTRKHLVSTKSAAPADNQTMERLAEVLGVPVPSAELENEAGVGV